MTVLQSPTEQVAYEARRRPRVALIAFIAGLLVVASLLFQEVGYKNAITEETVQLLTIHRRFPLDLVGAVLDAIGLLGTGAVLFWLNSISLARDPQLSPITRWLVAAGAPLMAVLEVVTITIYSIKSNAFASGHDLGYPAAYRLIHPIATLLGVTSLVEELGALLLAAGFIWTALNAMKVGLLPKPLGYAGVVAGALVIFAIGPISFVVQGGFLVCAAIIVAGRWPNEPPAWSEGIAIPWAPGGKPNREAASAAGVATVEPRTGRPDRDPHYVPRRKKKKR